MLMDFFFREVMQQIYPGIPGLLVIPRVPEFPTSLLCDKGHLLIYEPEVPKISLFQKYCAIPCTLYLDIVTCNQNPFCIISILMKILFKINILNM